MIVYRVAAGKSWTKNTYADIKSYNAAGNTIQLSNLSSFRARTATYVAESAPTKSVETGIKVTQEIFMNKEQHTYESVWSNPENVRHGCPTYCSSSSCRKSTVIFIDQSKKCEKGQLSFRAIHAHVPHWSHCPLAVVFIVTYVYLLSHVRQFKSLFCNRSSPRFSDRKLASLLPLSLSRIHLTLHCISKFSTELRTDCDVTCRLWLAWECIRKLRSGYSRHLHGIELSGVWVTMGTPWYVSRVIRQSSSFHDYGIVEMVPTGSGTHTVLAEVDHVEWFLLVFILASTVLDIPF